jgi:hypothetical protein
MAHAKRTQEYTSFSILLLMALSQFQHLCYTHFLKLIYIFKWFNHLGL